MSKKKETPDQKATRTFARAFTLTVDAGSFRQLDNEDVLFGTVRINGVAHHLTAIKVAQPTPGADLCATHDPEGRIYDVPGWSEFGGQTIEIPGFPGYWIVGIGPHAR